MESIVRLSEEDFEELVDFLNLVFSQADCPTDFEKIQPRLFKLNEENMKCHFAIRRNGRIQAVVGLYPMALNIQGKLLKVAGIGSVATHPKARKLGFMQKLMKVCLDEMRDQGFHLSCLGGDRLRYTVNGHKFPYAVHSIWPCAFSNPG